MQRILLSSSSYSLCCYSCQILCFTLDAVIRLMGAYSRYRGLFLNLQQESLSRAFLANYSFSNSTIAMALLGQSINLLTTPQNQNSSFSPSGEVLQCRFFTNIITLLLSHRFLSVDMKSRFNPCDTSHSLVSAITSASAKESLAGKLSERRMSDLVMECLSAMCLIRVSGFMNRVFHEVVSSSLCLISIFCFFLQEVGSSSGSPNFSLILLWYSSSFLDLMSPPMSSRAGLTWRILPQMILLSNSAKALRLSAAWEQVTNPYPLSLFLSSLGNLVFTTLPQALKMSRSSSSLRSWEKLVTQSLVQSTFKGDSMNLEFLQLNTGALILTSFSFFSLFNTLAMCFSLACSFSCFFSQIFGFFLSPSFLSGPFTLSSITISFPITKSFHDCLLPLSTIFLYSSNFPRARDWFTGAFSFSGLFLCFFSLFRTSLVLANSTWTLEVPTKLLLKWFLAFSASCSVLNPMKQNFLDLSPFCRILQSVTSPTLENTCLSFPSSQLEGMFFTINRLINNHLSFIKVNYPVLPVITPNCFSPIYL